MRSRMQVRIGVGVLLTLLGAVSVASAAGMAKSGKYTSQFGWIFKGDVQDLGPDRSVSTGVVSGVMFNTAGKPFLNKTLTACALILDVNKGQVDAKGTCTMTDVDGDKAFIEWKCKGTMPACPGDENFIGGTGKYTGLTGASTFQGNFIGKTGAGWSDWKGEYKLP